MFVCTTSFCSSFQANKCKILCSCKKCCDAEQTQCFSLQLFCSQNHERTACHVGHVCCRMKCAVHAPASTAHTSLYRQLRIGVFTLVTRGWAASEFLTHASNFNMTPNGEHQIMGPDRSHIFDAGVNFLTRASPT